MMSAMDDERRFVEEEDDEEHFTVIIKWKKVRTALVLSLFLCTGLSYAIHGPCLVNLMELLGADIVHISLALAMVGGGHLLAYMLSGLMFRRLDSELQFCVSSVLVSVSLIAAPWSRDIYGFMAACAVNGFGMGYMDTGGNSWLLSVWNGHGAKEPLVQAMGCIWSLANVLSTILVRPFLVEQVHNVTSPTVSPEVDDYGNQTENSNHDVTTIRYAYLFIGTIILGVAFALIFMYCVLGHHVFRTEVFTSKSSASEQRSQQTCFIRCGLFGVVLTFFVLLEFLEGVGSGYISLFVVSELGWSVKEGASVMSVYWGAYAASTCVSVAASYVVAARVLLPVAIVVACGGYTLLLAVHVLGAGSVYVAYVLAAMGTACTMPTMLLWAGSVLHSSTTISAVLHIGAGLGVILGYPIVGALMDRYGMMAYVYTTASASFSLLLLFIVLHIMSRSGSRNPDRERPKDHEEAMNPFAT